MFPDRVRAMLLNGLVDPVRYSKSAEARVAMFASFADEVFGRFLSLCESAGPERCALAGGERSPAERWERLLARLKRGPIPAPGGEGHGVVAPAVELQRSAVLAVSSGKGSKDVAARRGGSRRRASGRRIGARGRSQRVTSPDAWGSASTSAAIQCADGPARKGRRAWPQVFKRQQRISTLQGAVHFAWEWAPCASWPVRGEDAYRGPWNASTANPILLINQRYDPHTGYANAVRAERLLGNAVLLTQEGYGHLTFQDPSACVDQAMLDYLTELITSPRGTVSQSDQQPFDPDFR
jgi:hypothetical protein